MSRRPILFAALMLAAAPATAQPITVDMLKRHVAVLADDAYEGRAPGTAGGERAEAYVLEAFAQAGLAPGGEDGRWRQDVPLVERRAQTATIAVDGKALAGRYAILGGDQQVMASNAPVLFVGHGYPAEVARADLRGAVALILNGTPPGATGEPVPLRERMATLTAQGAVAVLLVAPDDAPFDRVAAGYARATAIDDPRPTAAPIATSGVVDAAAAQALTGLTAEALRSAATRPGFAARATGRRADLDVRTAVRRFVTANIVGKVTGRSVAREAVILSAHWDHVGICRPEGAPDRICNGAADNASGTAILIETARALAKGPRPERSVYFVATTAEELGLMGADAFAGQLPTAIGKAVANLNIDTTAIGPRGLPVAIIGRGTNPKLDAAIDATARAIGRQVDTDTEANVMATRQDGWAFGKRGIPAVMATGSVSDMKRLQAYLAGPYHTPEDDLSRIELAGAAEDADLHVALARALADPKTYPSD